MREIVKLGLILLLITSAAAVVLGLSNAATIGTIEAVEAKASEVARKEVLPEAENFKTLEEEKLNEILNGNEKVLEVYAGYKGENIVGYAIKTATPGYGGNVEVITGISTEGKITGIKVVKHQETPGLGANATSAEFQNQYKDMNTSKEITVVKTQPSNENEIQALTGATITSDAVTNGVNIARELFNNKLSK
ncbi:RnfABCDGE type electron transport complex subunit G [Thermohalobacter berrensis]|uniref:Ion-translocating oxidoreductase complex subunit G n=1 Tax=Thermohalobacter berrensis TaxID=99594 RepID=A0A419T6X2_9FIRM|nr:RnfABCDGE type electron transport complex subunit G [Thermohalobacter berrensis]RKD33192.1 electron transporter RnfG [Thermohalobacter berrensis]